MRTSRVVIVLGAVTLITLAPSVRAQDAEDPSRDAIQRMTKAVMRNDQPGLYAAMEQLWNLDAKRGGQSCVELITKGHSHHRPIALDILAKRATGEQLVGVVGMLGVNKYPEERRWLLRWAGTKEDATVDLLTPHLRDQDRYVQIAAVLALADLGDVTAMRELSRSLPPPPLKGRWAGDKSEMLAMAKYGAVRTLTGLRPDSSTDVRRWMRENARGLDGMSPPSRPDPAESFEFDKDQLRTPSLDIRFAAENYGEVIKSAGIESWAEFAIAMERAVEFSSASAASIFGPIHLPAIELILADQRSIARYGGTSRGYLGFALGNRISMMFRDWPFVQGTLAHEYIHIIHGANYEDQPRWLSEGLAESLTRSPNRSMWKAVGPSGQRRPAPRTGRGFCLSITRWDSEGSTNENPDLYTRAHLFTDYLRFGFVAGEARLACLMGRLSRGDPSQRAIEAVYGVLVDQMDAGLDEWLATDP